MRILTVRQPWAWAIVHGGKDVENRSRNIAGSYRGPVAVHVALADPRVDDIAAVESRLEQRYGLDWAAHMAFTEPIRGHIIGVVDLVDVHHATSCPTNPDDAPWPLCSRWAERDGYHLVLANPRRLAEPIPYRGALGMRTLDDATIARVLGAIA